ncbi:hypothetical protein [Oceanicoccus sagamiensis]|uniref:DUF1585 domain-containing protein n=1 Tax=Oceanicoccus sagamiensis TaxID=716816 RepID=A0A1X9N6A2_9GAMM|nr:hypothetical protein [Oceanicoccus sagamiensis]ARN72791.1 hypothetical protein BST96_00895 [Oceanicoccus sagamiensis]
MNKKSALAVVTLALFASSFVDSATEDRERAKFIHDRLTGVMPTDAMLDLMENSIAVDGDVKQAARYAIDGNTSQGDAYGDVITPSGGFYNAVLKSWASPWTNEEQDVFQALNDYSATVIGLVRDSDDFRKLLYDNVIYTGNVSGISAYSNSNNAHYEALESSSADMGDSDILVRSTQSSVTGINAAGVAGVMTTRAAARAFFIDGTNRAMFRFTVLNHLCDDLEQYKDNALPTDRIRQDVSRSPGGDSSIFLNECSACHTGMDAMAQAFAYHQYDYPSEDEAPGNTEEERKEMGRMVYTPGSVQEKYTINSGNFREGFVTTNDHWINYWRTGPNAQKVGWFASAASSSLDEAINPAYSEGDGAASLGQELANSDAFAYCQVKKAFKTICLREPHEGDDDAAFATIVGDFKTGGFDMKQAFIDVAEHCSGTYLSTLN